jgi:hypothetical protein
MQATSRDSLAHAELSNVLSDTSFGKNKVAPIKTSKKHLAGSTSETRTPSRQIRAWQPAFPIELEQPGTENVLIRGNNTGTTWRGNHPN